jgi:ammonium transporter Rh
VIDYGGSMSIHIFGAYFGLAFSYILGKKIKLGAKKPEPDYISCIYGMIGTLFLWLFWPSFNAGSI